MNLQDQKLALAAKFPQVLRSHPPSILMFWRDTGLEVTDREWLEVAHRLELRLDDKQHEQFRAWLCVTIEQDRVPKNFTLAEAMAIADRNERKYASATAPQRVESLCRTLFPERFKMTPRHADSVGPAAVLAVRGGLV